MCYINNFDFLCKCIQRAFEWHKAEKVTVVKVRNALFSFFK